MKTLLGCKNLAHSKLRTLIAATGVAFACTLIFVQLGFKGGVATTATIIYDKLDFDILLRSPDYLHLVEARSFPRERLSQAAATDGVTIVRPFYIAIHQWQNPETGEPRGIVVMGTDPQDPVFSVPEIRRKAAKLVAPELVLIDTKTRRDYGPRNGEQFGEADIDVATSLGLQQVQIIDHFELGTGLAANGAVLMNIQGFARTMQGYQSAQDVSLGLVRVKDPEQVDQVIKRLREKFSSLAISGSGGESAVDVEVLSREEAFDFEKQRWLEQTPIGRIFEIGVYVALFIGAVIVYQILSSNISNMMNEYGTLRAMGYSLRYLTGVVMQEAVVLAILGYALALVIALLCYQITTKTSGLPITMTGMRMIGVFVLSLSMCVASGWIAQRKLRKVDPADLY